MPQAIGVHRRHTEDCVVDGPLSEDGATTRPQTPKKDVRDLKEGSYLDTVHSLKNSCVACDNLLWEPSIVGHGLM